MAQFVINIPDDAPVDFGNDLHWRLTRAVLEALEEGSSDHCLYYSLEEEGGPVFRHHRLQATIVQTAP